MLALAQAGLDIAPMPLGLIRDGLQHPAVVETWLTRAVSDEPPTIDGEWEQLVRHLAQIHRITPESCAVGRPGLRGWASRWSLTACRTSGSIGPAHWPANAATWCALTSSSTASLAHIDAGRGRLRDICLTVVHDGDAGGQCS